MAKLIILGSANAIPDELHENTHLAVQGSKRTLLIDCVGNPLLRLHRAGLDFHQLSDLILTHFHPDHVGGVPLLLMDMWLLGRRSKLNVHGLPHTIDRIEKLMELYDWGNWPDFFPVSFHRLPDLDKTLVLENPEFRVYASPVCHLIPAIGLRIEFLESGKTLAYSCDTEPCQAVIDLAAGANILIHEATGAGPGHSSAAQAAQVARQAKVGSLYLIHYTNGPEHEPGALIHEAQAYFPGEVRLAEDFLEIEL